MIYFLNTHFDLVHWSVQVFTGFAEVEGPYKYAELLPLK